MTSQKWVKPLHYDDWWYEKFDDQNDLGLLFEISSCNPKYTIVDGNNDFWSPWRLICLNDGFKETWPEYHWLGHP